MTKDKSRSRGWIWFFVTLALLTGTAITVQVWYNLSHQLSPQQLAEARARWQARGPSDYDMEYTIQKPDSLVETYEVQVRRGKVMSVRRNGQALEERLHRFSDMPALFGFIDEFLKQDAPDGQKPRRRVYAKADFDREDGHLIHYVRSVTSTRERVEITVKLRAEPVNAGQGAASGNVRDSEATGRSRIPGVPP